MTFEVSGTGEAPQLAEEEKTPEYPAAENIEPHGDKEVDLSADGQIITPWEISAEGGIDYDKLM